MGMHWIKEQEKLNVLLKGPTPVFHSARSVIYVSSILNDTDLVWEKVRQVLVMEQSLGQAVDMNQGVQGVFLQREKLWRQAYVWFKWRNRVWERSNLVPDPEHLREGYGQNEDRRSIGWLHSMLEPQVHAGGRHNKAKKSHTCTGLI